MSINDRRTQMRLNIKWHRQKRLQRIECTDDTHLKSKIKSVSNDIEKSNLNHNVKPIIASNTEVQTPKLLPTIKVTNYRNKPTIQVKTYEAVIDTKPKNPEVLTDNNIKKYKTRSSITVNQLPPNMKVNIQDEPISNFELKLKPLPNIEIKDPEPPVIIKKLKEQLIEELLDSSTSEEIEDNISVGNNDDWNDIYQKHNVIDVDENDSSNLRLTEAVGYDAHKQLANDISKEKCKYQ